MGIEVHQGARYVVKRERPGPSVDSAILGGSDGKLNSGDLVVCKYHRRHRREIKGLVSSAHVCAGARFGARCDINKLWQSRTVASGEDVRHAGAEMVVYYNMPPDPVGHRPLLALKIRCSAADRLPSAGGRLGPHRLLW